MTRTLTELVRLEVAQAIRSLQRTGFAVVGALLACGLIFAALGCAVAALWLAMVPLVGQAGAALCAALALLLLATAILLLMRQVIRTPRLEPVVTVADLSGLFVANKAVILSSVLAAGFAAGSRRA